MAETDPGAEEDNEDLLEKHDGQSCLGARDYA